MQRERREIKIRALNQAESEEPPYPLNNTRQHVELAKNSNEIFEDKLNSCTSAGKAIYELNI